MIENGSVAGAVTLEKVLNRQATKVGTAFARLLINGFSIERALDLARREAILGKGYLGVGDGTHTLSQGVNNYAPMMIIEPEGFGRFSLKTVAFTPRDPGGIHQSYLREDENFHLFGNEIDLEIAGGTLVNHLDRSQTPVIYDGRFFWSDDLAAELRTELE